jgi:hypothetical protein
VKTACFEAIQKRPDRAVIQIQWIERAIQETTRAVVWPTEQRRT